MAKLHDTAEILEKAKRQDQHITMESLTAGRQTRRISSSLAAARAGQTCRRKEPLRRLVTFLRLKFWAYVCSRRAEIEDEIRANENA